MRRSLVVSLVVVVVIALGSLLATLLSGNTPQLGLDLQGGASIVLQPHTKVDSGVLDQAIEIIRNRVDALGVAEPEITRQGTSIIVSLPGVKNKDRALEVVGQTAQLLFRPVVQQLPADAPTTTSSPPTSSTTSTTIEGTPATTVPPDLSTTTPPEQDDETKQVILPEQDANGKVTARYLLGPAAVKGQALSGASATVAPNTGVWEVEFSLTSEGTKQWNDMATSVGTGGQIAIDLDGVVRSAPSLDTTDFPGSGVITGNFTQSEAKDLALVLKYGALPVQLDRQTVQTVSASLGRDSLRAGLAAGAVGLLLVGIYMLLYYRALGIVVWLGLGITAAIMYSLVTFLGHTSGLALSLSGTTGIIVSVGVTVDSYVVYFERLKDEIRSGKTIRSSVDRGFSRAYRTILAADAASIIGALVLYVLSVGSVRGFAFFLGLSTLLDVITAYFFTRPMVVLLGRSRFFTEARWMGVARGLNAAPTNGPLPAPVREKVGR
ncbi:MAG TPA: protein translocase subunit SecD [Acidimicrobiales bacterium]|jgi:preprotein translocase subunit SecD|nr:protein translocase subunit SecD [Acidimicrobiales bacterium]